MKKHLIAAAVAAAVAVPAMAQNVTLYGIIDGGYTDFQAKVAGVKTTTSGVNESANVSSRWGLRGSEDLGGGMKANFNIETGIGTGDNAGSYGAPGTARTNTRAGINTQTDAAGAWVNTTNIGNRAMWVGLSTSGGTEVRIGLQNTPVRDVALAYNADGATNVVGNLLAGNSAAFADRHNAIALIQTMGAFRGSVQLASKGVKADGSDKVESKDGYGLSLQYASGPLSLGLGHNKYDTTVNAVTGVYNVITDTGAGVTDVTQAATCTASATVACITVTAPVTATKTETKTTVAGGNYNFGFATVSLAYGKQEVTESVAATKGENKVWSLGARVPMGATTFFATYSDGNYQATAAGRKNNQDGMVLGASYAMSKRTSLYAIYGTADIETAATTKTEYRQISAGLVHSF